MKICWIGTSYFSMGEANDETGTPKDFVYYIAQRHPNHNFLNLSIPGVGMDHFPVRVEYALEKECTHFFIEITGGLRKNFISSVSDRVPHPKFLRVQEYEKGKRTFVMDEKQQLLLDSFTAGLDNNELRETFIETDFPFMHDSSFWDMTRKFSLMIDDRFNRCQHIHNALNIQARLESLGKKVLFYEWGMNSSHRKSKTQNNKKTGKQVFTVCCPSADRAYSQLNIFSDPWPLEVKWMVQDEVVKHSDIDVLIEQFLPEEDPREQYFLVKNNEWTKANYYDGTHLNDEGLRKYSSTFDQVIWDWENNGK